VQARAADLVALDQPDVETGAGAVERGGVATWSAPDDHHIMLGAQNSPRCRGYTPKIEPIGGPSPRDQDLHREGNENGETAQEGGDDQAASAHDFQGPEGAARLAREGHG
jgi:hypothetical protein